jgi:hypothetical protein
MLNLNSEISELNIFFHELPESGDFNPSRAIVNWDFKPLLSQDKSYIDDIIVDVKSIKLLYSFTTDIDDAERDEELEILPNSEWDIEYEISRTIDDQLIEPQAFLSIQSISFYFQEKRVEISILN